MKLQFDPNQPYQIDAVNSTVDIFKGQPLNKGDFEVELNQPEGQLLHHGEIVIGNNLLLAQETVLENLRSIQKKNDIEPSKRLGGLHFSLEMETGTGKTYVYLRTIYELNKKYGFKKFIIVVPSIAIKEGVVKNLEITKEHFGMLYENTEMDYYVYDPRKRGNLKSFATTNALQILVINIDSFAKFNEEKAGKNIIYKDSDWGVPIEYIQGVSPIVIVDEPQNMETEIRKRAIENLNPLCTFRYSATHKFHYNLVYKLDPVKAYDLGLVKKIEVDSVIEKNSLNDAFVELVSIKSSKNTISIKLKIDVNTKDGINRKLVSIKKSPKKTSVSDLYKLSNEREVYKDGFIVDAVDIAGQSITFSNGMAIRVGQTQGGMTDEIMKFQIKNTVQNHFEVEKRLKDKNIKVLSLFFIDRVANYRNYDKSTEKKGKFADWFEEAFNEINRKRDYKGLIPYKAAEIHNGYFSQDRKTGVLKDTKGDTRADDDTYALIMKDKERLLSVDTPLRFIFSHSALREGWDNPNVFQICTLNETRSDLKKRQEIGRGLRLPVNQDGERVFDENINILTVIANESYEDFAKTLQTEIEDECGVAFKGRIKNKRHRRKAKLKKGYELDENFKQLWERIKHKTKYRVEYNSQKLIDKAGKAVSNIEISKPRIVSVKAKLNITKKGIDTDFTGISDKGVDFDRKNVPDILGYIQSKTRLTKDTILKILKKSEKISDIFVNPQQFMDVSAQEINRILSEMMIEGIKYEKIAGEFWEMKRFGNEELEGYLGKTGNMFPIKKQGKTLYNYVLVDSSVESDFAKDLETREDVKFYIKLPYWFTIETPIGTYNPDWAIVFEKDKKVYFVAETKSEGQELRGSEQMKIHCGKKHFEKFDSVKFQAPVTKVSEIVI
ncbi:MAG TPA: DEAD/DEAH box helicase family protein [Nitrospinota bacterium]|nr:DEAD/DEAH box helicase family protein [Nitrospinota bacterium]|tara:strand:+ start:3874 stop:6549 length:2676 start_codon:yes stop_codon:yes gene_type:complete